ncbi:MAG TPA: TRAM domain-containing protein, partial [Thermoanaerobaculia bacterium]|nr:TRAM domain-containing protein [Thermoanaerobaculia bacterium]
MTSGRRLTIERLAPTGEGVARDAGKVVFVDGALPGETVVASVFREKARYARAAAREILDPAPERRETDAHGAACGGTEWAHVLPDAARRWKRVLFLETMERIGRVPASHFGELPVSSSPLEYRLRNRFHASAGAIGFYGRRSHTIVPLDGCEIVSAETRSEVATLAANRPEGTLETLESVETGPGHHLAWRAQGKRF